LLPSGISIDIFKTEKGQPGAPQGRPDKPSRLEGYCLEDRLERLQEYFNLVKVRLIQSAVQPLFANICSLTSPAETVPYDVPGTRIVCDPVT
jgi:hypothetical protein